jgi:hypothetical protein
MGILLQKDVHGFSVGFLKNPKKRDKTQICDGLIANNKKISCLIGRVNKTPYTPDFRDNFVPKIKTKMILVAGKSLGIKFVDLQEECRRIFLRSLQGQ